MQKISSSSKSPRYRNKNAKRNYLERIRNKKRRRTKTPLSRRRKVGCRNLDCDNSDDYEVSMPNLFGTTKMKSHSNNDNNNNNNEGDKNDKAKECKTEDNDTPKKKIEKQIVIPDEFIDDLSATPSPITSPICDEESFYSSVYGRKIRKTILSNIDPSLMNTLRELNNDELELNLSLTLNIDSIDIGLNDNNNNHNHESIQDNDNDHYYQSYRQNLNSDYVHIESKKDSMKVLGNKSKIRRIYFRELCMKSFPDTVYNYLNVNKIESLSLYTGDTSSLIAFISKCGRYPTIKKIEIDGTSPFRWRCSPLLETLRKCTNLCSLQLPSIVDAVDIIAFDAFLNAAVNLTEFGLITGDRQLFKPIHDVIAKHGFRMAINPSGLRYIFAKRKNKQKLKQKYKDNKEKYLRHKAKKAY